MRKSTHWQLHVLFSILLILSVIFPAIGAGQKKVATYKVKNFNTQGVKSYQGVLDWTITSKKDSLVFAKTFDTTSSTYSIVCYKTNFRGKPSFPTTLLSNIGYVFGAKAIWVSPDTDFSTTAASSGGLFYALIVEAPYGTNDSGKEAILAVARFDEKGKRIGDWKTISIIPGLENSGISYSLSAGQGPKTAGVIITAEYFLYQGTPGKVPHYGYKKALALFLETDFEGRVAGEISTLPLGGGSSSAVKAFDPVWNGSRWLVPVNLTAVVRETNSSGNITARLVADDSMYIYTAEQGKGLLRKIKYSKIVSSANNKGTVYIKSYTRANLVPYPSLAKSSGTSAPAGTRDFLLFAGHRNTVPSSEVKFEFFTYDYSLFKIDRLGKRQGKTTKVKIPSIKHKINPNFYPGFSLAQTEYITDIITNYPEGLANPPGTNTMYLSHANNVTFYDWKTRTGPSEYQFNLYAIDPMTGKVQLLATNIELLSKIKRVEKPFVRWFNGRIAAINTLTEWTSSPYKVQSFYSSFKQ